MSRSVNPDLQEVAHVVHGQDAEEERVRLVVDLHQCVDREALRVLQQRWNRTSQKVKQRRKLQQHRGQGLAGCNLTAETDDAVS